MKQSKTSQTCLSCQNTFTGKFCNHCGEKIIGSKDRTLKVLISEFGSAIFNLDNKFFKTIRLVMLKPGQLSENYARGKRKAFFKPSSLYILLTVVYFIFTPFQLFVPSLYVHTNSTGYANYAQKKVDAFLLNNSITQEQLETRYSEIAPGIAKWLILLYIPALGIILMLLFLNKRDFIADHFLLSIEINIYNIFAHFLLLPVLMTVFYIFSELITGHSTGINDTILVPLMGLSLLRFILLSFRHYYQQKWWIILIKSVLFIFALGSFAFYIYRFIHFWIAMQLI